MDIRKLNLTEDQALALVGNTNLPANNFVQVYLSIFDCLGSYLHDEEIGLRLAENLHDYDMGTLGMLVMNARTIGDHLRLGVQYQKVLGEYFSIWHLSQTEESVRLDYELTDPCDSSPKHDITLTLARRLQFIRKHIRPEWNPKVVSFSFQTPNEIERYRAVFGENLLFDQTTNFIEIESRFLDIPIRDADPQLLEVLMDSIQQLLPPTPDESLRQRTKRLLISKIGSEVANQEQVARELNMSRATLQRKLGLESTSFRELKDEVVFELASRALTRSEAQISQIAFSMGYSELSAFDRAFIRLSGGITPSQFRKNG